MGQQWMMFGKNELKSHLTVPLRVYFHTTQKYIIFFWKTKYTKKIIKKSTTKFDGNKNISLKAAARA